MKRCTKCGNELPEADFAPRGDNSARLRSWCRRCEATLQSSINRRKYEADPKYYSDAVKRQRVRNQNKLRDYLTDKSCIDCGEADAVVLQFDHVRGEKVINVSLAIKRWKWSRVLEEIAKCEIRCANCHARKTAKQFGYWNAEAV